MKALLNVLGLAAKDQSCDPGAPSLRSWGAQDMRIPFLASCLWVTGNIGRGNIISMVPRLVCGFMVLEMDTLPAAQW